MPQPPSYTLCSIGWESEKIIALVTNAFDRLLSAMNEASISILILEVVWYASHCSALMSPLTLVEKSKSDFGPHSTAVTNKNSHLSSSIEGIVFYGCWVDSVFAFYNSEGLHKFNSC